MTIERANPVWAADITSIPIGRGFLYLVAIIDWASRAALAWRLSNTMDVSFCLAALEEALAKFGKPEIFNTDQGSQFTSAAFTEALTEAGVAISMDGRGRWMDNVFIERLWRSLKYEDVYLKGYADGREALRGIAEWIVFYNERRPHQALADRTPMAVSREAIEGAGPVDMQMPRGIPLSRRRPKHHICCIFVAHTDALDRSTRRRPETQRPIRRPLVRRLRWWPRKPGSSSSKEPERPPPACRRRGGKGNPLEHLEIAHFVKGKSAPLSSFSAELEA